MPYLLGLDVGGTKTLAAVCDDSGRVAGVARAGGANYQDAGSVAAAREIGTAIAGALARAGAGRGDVVAAAFGVSGADREQDFAAVHALLDPVSPVARYALVNDTLVALRAGTRDGVGVCCIGGTGANCIGRNRLGVVKKVGGLGFVSGDSGSAGDLVGAAITAALWGHEGRGPETALYGRLCAELGLRTLEDVVDLGFFSRVHALDLGRIAPLVFETAAAGDAVAIAVLEAQGRGVAGAALCAARALFAPGDEVTVVLAGSVLARGSHDALRDTITQALTAALPRCRVVRLTDEPVIGALLLARDVQTGLAEPAFAARLRETYREP
ncbi:MAG TPA: BadF/BadG/BcrA/BcrD ATPase family protein [Polyangia bacterium]|jgi:N-acetylglucosamine kinase-like BadF-type ATPase